LAQDQEIGQVMARFQADTPNGVAVQELEVLLRTAVFKSANQVVGYLLQRAANRIDANYQPPPGYHYKGRATIMLDGIFGFFELERDYYYHPGKKQAIARPMRRWAWRAAPLPLWPDWCASKGPMPPVTRKPRSICARPEASTSAPVGCSAWSRAWDPPPRSGTSVRP
jgi:hypothetical protein